MTGPTGNETRLRGEEALAEGEEAGAERVAAGGEGALVGFVFGAAGGGLDRDGRVAEGREVVGAGAHVDFADGAGKFEAVGDELAGGKGREFKRPFVEIHAGVEAAALLVLRRGLAGGLEPVERARGDGEKAEGVEVRAGDGRGLDDGGEGVGRVAERVGVVADFFRGLAVNHGPLVQAEAAEEGGTRLHRLKEIAEPDYECVAVNGERGGVESDGGGTVGQGDLAILGPAEEGAGGFAGEGDIGTGVPAAKPGGAEGVVAEKKIVNGMFFSARGTGLMRVGPRAHADLVGRLAGEPDWFGKDRENSEFAELQGELSGGEDCGRERCRHQHLTGRARRRDHAIS